MAKKINIFPAMFLSTSACLGLIVGILLFFVSDNTAFTIGNTYILLIQTAKECSITEFNKSVLNAYFHSAIPFILIFLSGFSVFSVIITFIVLIYEYFCFSYFFINAYFSIINDKTLILFLSYLISYLLARAMYSYSLGISSIKIKHSLIELISKKYSPESKKAVFHYVFCFLFVSGLLMIAMYLPLAILRYF